MDLTEESSMVQVIQISSKFKKPLKNRKNLYYKPKVRKPGVQRRRAMVKQPIYLPKSKYVNFFHKAKKECPTAAPVHDVMELLLEYYLQNEFIINRRMVLVNDPTSEKHVTYKRRKVYESLYKQGQEPSVRLWMMLTKARNKQFVNKVKRDGVSKSYAFNLLIDFYMSNQFLIKTTIVRVNRYRTGNPKKDIKLLPNREEEKKLLTKNHDRFI